MKAGLKAPVGDSSVKRAKDKPKVRNTPEDVSLLRSMLEAGGTKVGLGTKVDRSLISAIKDVQRKAGMKTPDGIADPGGTLEKHLEKSFAAALRKGEVADPQKPVMMRPVRFRGETLHLLPEDWEKALDGFCSTAERFVELYENVSRHQRKAVVMILDGYDLQKDFWNNIGSVVISSVSLQKPPDFKLVNALDSQISKLKQAIRKRSVSDMDFAISQCDLAVFACRQSIEDYFDRFQFSAKITLGGSVVVGAVCGALFVAKAAPLVAMIGVGAKTAGAISGAGLATLVTAQKEAVKVPMGKSKGFSDALVTVFYEGLLGAVSGALSGIPAGYGREVATRMSSNAVKLFPHIPKKLIEGFLIRLVRSRAFEEALKTAVEVTMKKGVDYYRNDKKLKTKDFTEAVVEIVFSALSVGIFDKLDKNSKQFASKEAHRIADSIVGDRLKVVLKPLKDVKLDRKVKEEIMEGAHKAIYQNVLKSGWLIFFESAGINDGASKQLDTMAGKLEKDAAIKKQADDALVKQLRKNGVKV